MPPLPADSIHARACKLKCEKILTRPTNLVGSCRYLSNSRIFSINLLLYFLRIFLDHKFAHRQKKSARRMGTFHRRAGFATFQLALRLHRFLAWKFVMECSLRSSGCLTSAFAVSRSIFSAANCCISSVMWEYVFRVVALDT